MNNPGLKTLLSILQQIKEKGPLTFYQLSLMRSRAYGLVSRYLKFCLKSELIEIHSQHKGRGPYLSKKYQLSPKGHQLINIFERKNDEQNL